MSVQLPFDNSYARLPESFFARVLPTPVKAPALVKLNRPLAVELGLDPDALGTPEGVEILAGKRIPVGAEPLAMAYAGHQFGHFVPQLGDGRAILLGEVIDREGRRFDVQLKGAGRTPFSRGGDGRAALGPVLREYLVSEAMAALGIPTTRALAAVLTGDKVLREAILPGAVLTRVAWSHVRVGSFQYFAARGNTEGVRHLADFAIARVDPVASTAPHPYRAFLDGVVERQASLVARWLLVGFVHGVMNTDNMAVSGETIDYGPCAFIDAYDPAAVFSSIDHAGRYAYANQPSIAQWNLARLAECLIPLLGETQEEGLEQAKAAIGRFPDLFRAAYLEGACRKLGISRPREDDASLMQALLDRMAAANADFTRTFRGLCEIVERDEGGLPGLAEDALADWIPRWRTRLADDPAPGDGRAAAMRRANPAIIPRNHRVEEVIAAAVEREDFGPFERLREALGRPYEEDPGRAALVDPPPDGGKGYVTFCGT
jgi:uncharacterized protein YdiU (UPF0061 family)